MHDGQGLRQVCHRAPGMSGRTNERQKLASLGAKVFLPSNKRRRKPKLAFAAILERCSLWIAGRKRSTALHPCHGKLNRIQVRQDRITNAPRDTLLQAHCRFDP